jgi:phosphate transport system substrate-binding protein
MSGGSKLPSRALLVAMTMLLAGHAAAQQRIAIDGSTGTAPLVEALGKAFTAKSGIAVDVGKGLGTKARFEALSSGKINIAMASHGLNIADVTKRGMSVHHIAMTPVLFGVHGADLAIAPLVRPESEVDMEVVRDGLACFKDLKIIDGARSLPRAGDMAKALAETPGAIGMTSATFIAQSKSRIKALSLNGTAASEDNIVAGKYRLTRDSFLVTSNAPSAPVKAFIDFIIAAEGAAAIKANGAIAAAK